MAESKKSKYLSKTVKFGGKEVILYSLDGMTWSTRRQELTEIKERQERDKVSFAAIKEEDGETRVVAKSPAAKGVEDDDDAEVGFEVDDQEFPIVDEDEPAIPGKRGRPAKAGKPIEVKAAKKSAEKAAAPAKKISKPVAKTAKSSKVAPKKRAISKPTKQSKSKVKAKKKAA